MTNSCIAVEKRVIMGRGEDEGGDFILSLMEGEVKEAARGDRIKIIK